MTEFTDGSSEVAAELMRTLRDKALFTERRRLVLELEAAATIERYLPARYRAEGTQPL